MAHLASHGHGRILDLGFEKAHTAVSLPFRYHVFFAGNFHIPLGPWQPGVFSMTGGWDYTIMSNMMFHTFFFFPLSDESSPCDVVCILDPEARKLVLLPRGPRDDGVFHT